MNAHRAAAELPAVQHHVVLLCERAAGWVASRTLTEISRRCSEEIKMLGNWGAKRVVRCIPATRLRLPLIHREAVHPAEGEDLWIRHVCLKCNLNTQTPEHLCREDALTGNGKDEITLWCGALPAARTPDRLNRLW